MKDILATTFLPLMTQVAVMVPTIATIVGNYALWHVHTGYHSKSGMHCKGFKPANADLACLSLSSSYIHGVSCMLLQSTPCAMRPCEVLSSDPRTLSFLILNFNCVICSTGGEKLGCD